MLSIPFNQLVSHLTCCLLVTFFITPSSAQFEKRIQQSAHKKHPHHHNHHHRAANVVVKKVEPDLNMWGQARDTLAFDGEFSEVTSLPNVHFS